MVTLKGQFDEEPERTPLKELIRFANPVSKNGEPIFDKNAHLSWYSLYSPEPRRSVKIENQFGRQEILIYQAIGLLVPTRKIERGLVFPEKLGHFKIYRIIEGRPVDKDVKLQDQFLSREAKVTYPVAFAVPVKKEHEGTAIPIRNEKAHLTIYKISPSRDIPKTISVRNQFGTTRYLKIGVSYLLAVPSLKVEWKEVD